MKNFRLFSTVLAIALAATLVFAACTDGGETDEKKLESIAVTTQPTKTEYLVGEYFDRSGMVVTANYSDGTDEPVISYTVDKTAPLTLADTVVTVAYQQKTATVNITVNAPPPKELETMATIETAERRTYRVEAENLSLEWCTAGVETPKVEVPAVNAENTSGGKCISGLGNGGNELGLKVESKVETTLSITVCAAYGNPDGMPFDSCITTYWNDKKVTTGVRVFQSHPELTYWDWMTFTIEELTLQKGENTLWFKISSAAPWFDYFEFNVNPKVLDHIEVTGVRDHREYEKFDTSSMVVTAHYEDETSEPVTNYTVACDGVLTKGRHSVTVTHKKKSANVEFDVTDMITTADAGTYRIEGESVETSGTSGWVADYNVNTSGGKLLAGFVSGDRFNVKFNSTVAGVKVTATVCAAYGSVAGFDFGANVKTYWNGTEIPIENVVIAASQASVDAGVAWYDWNTFDIPDLTMQEGVNTLTFEVQTVNFFPNFDYFDFTVEETKPQTVYKVEAERADILSTSHTTPTSDKTSGGQFLDNLAANDTVSFSFESETSGHALVMVCISYGGEFPFDGNIATYWNDGAEKVTTGIHHIPEGEDAIAKWDNWHVYTLPVHLAVREGTNTLKFEVTGAPVRFDYVEFVLCDDDVDIALTGSASVRAEAESYSSAGNVEYNGNASNNSCLGSINGSFDVVIYSTLEKPCTVTVTICAAYGATLVFDDGATLLWNGTEVSTNWTLDSAAENKWNDFLTFSFTVELNPGRNVLSFRKESGTTPNMDYFDFTVTAANGGAL